MSTKTHLVTVMSGSEGKAVSDAVRSQSKYVAGFVGILNRLKAGMTPMQALAGGIGITQDALSMQYRNQGVDPKRMDAQLSDAWSLELPPDAQTANQALASAEDDSRGGVIPTWALWGIGIMGVVLLAPGVLGASRLGRRGRGSFRRRPSFRFRPVRPRRLRFSRGRR